MYDGLESKLEYAQKMAEFADRGSLTEGQFLKRLLGRDQKRRR